MGTEITLDIGKMTLTYSKNYITARPPAAINI